MSDCRELEARKRLPIPVCACVSHRAWVYFSRCACPKQQEETRSKDEMTLFLFDIYSSTNTVSVLPESPGRTRPRTFDRCIFFVTVIGSDFFFFFCKSCLNICIRFFGRRGPGCLDRGQRRGLCTFELLYHSSGMLEVETKQRGLGCRRGVALWCSGCCTVFVARHV